MWIDYDKDWYTFVREGLNKPNTLVVFEDSETTEQSVELLGTMNLESSYCGSCCSRKYDTILRYKYLGDIEGLYNYVYLEEII